jgi:hypothetical protein
VAARTCTTSVLWLLRLRAAKRNRRQQSVLRSGAIDRHKTRLAVLTRAWPVTSLAEPAAAAIDAAVRGA